MFYVHILESGPSGRYCIRSAGKDVAQALAQRNSGMMKSTRLSRPWQLVYTETFGAPAEARMRESQIGAWKGPTYMQRALGPGT